MIFFHYFVIYVSNMRTMLLRMIRHRRFFPL